MRRGRAERRRLRHNHYGAAKLTAAGVTWNGQYWTVERKRVSRRCPMSADSRRCFSAASRGWHDRVAAPRRRLRGKVVLVRWQFKSVHA